MCVCVSECVCVYVFVCVCEREREREKERFNENLIAAEEQESNFFNLGREKHNKLKG